MGDGEAKAELGWAVKPGAEGAAKAGAGVAKLLL